MKTLVDTPSVLDGVVWALCTVALWAERPRRYLFLMHLIGVSNNGKKMEFSIES